MEPVKAIKPFKPVKPPKPSGYAKKTIYHLFDDDHS